MRFIEIIALFGIPSALTTTMFFLLRSYFGVKIDAASKKRLEKFKHDLSQISEETKFDFQRKIQDFSLYTIKKHEVYGEFNKLILKAESKILGLYGFRSELTYEEYNKNDLRRIMEKDNFPEGKINQIFQVWEKQAKEQALEILRDFYRLKEFSDANNTLIEAKNYFWSSIFYFSEEVEKNAKEIIDNFSDFLIRQEMIYKKLKASYETNNKLALECIEIKKNIPNLIENLIKNMRDELKIGYYK